MGESMVGLERASSIENEPLTLNIQQIQFAREAALCVVNTRSVEEAVRIFTVGLEPVLSGGRGNNGTMVDYGEEVDYSIHHLTSPRFKDIASAPF